MSTYTATVRWSRNGDEGFATGRYSRAHEWVFDGGAVVPASASPDNVPEGTADEAGVDPEEAFIASISSCHMLFFVDYARREGFVLDSYVDKAVGIMEKNADGKIAVTRVTLRPRVVFSGKAPSAEQIEQIHHRAHDDCFIANSVKTEIRVESQAG